MNLTNFEYEFLNEDLTEAIVTAADQSGFWGFLWTKKYNARIYRQSKVGGAEYWKFTDKTIYDKWPEVENLRTKKMNQAKDKARWQLAVKPGKLPKAKVV